MEAAGPEPEDNEAEDPTQVVPATAAAGHGAYTEDVAGLSGAADDAGRAWFDEWLHGFLAALTQNQDGRPRTDLERRALASAARDMIARVGWGESHDGPLPQGASLTTDQLLANTYQVRALIARGGVGEIYRARHRDLRTDHAIKILQPRHTLDTTLVTLMMNEARLLQTIRHEGVVACHGLLRDSDGRLLLVMEHLRGHTLSDRLQEGPLPEPELLLLLRRLAQTLAAVHAQQIVHNDLSPDNIILRDGSAREATLIDFGLARSLAEPEETQILVDFAGKYSWVSPEQLEGHDAKIDTRSDLYSLGLVIAAAGRGQRLEMGQDLPTARAARQKPPLLEGVPAAIAPLVRRLLAPDAKARPQTAQEILDVLDGAKPARTGLLGWFNR